MPKSWSGYPSAEQWLFETEAHAYMGDFGAIYLVRRHAVDSSPKPFRDTDFDREFERITSGVDNFMDKLEEIDKRFNDIQPTLSFFDQK